MQVAGKSMSRLGYLMSASALLVAVTAARADDVPQPHHQGDSASQERSCKAATQDAATREEFDGVQVETSDIGLFEQFFDAVLRAPLVQHADHPQADRLRGYCYRGVLVVVRQDLRTARPTGWVQLNFRVPDVAAVQEELEGAYQTSSLSRLSEDERTKIVRFRLKPDVMRGNRKVIRLEVAGPEGFMIGFDQVK
jgi:hypothetical protein